MKTKKPNAELVWKQLDDLLVPRLRLTVIDRVIYSHLLRHTRLEGKHRLRFSIVWLARNIRMSTGAARLGVRRLVAHGALRLVQRTKAGHLVDVCLPAEIRACGLAGNGRRTGRERQLRSSFDIERADFMQNRRLRKTIHLRERGKCFYCLRRISPDARCLDHVVPLSQFGTNSYRNLVSCCMECNSLKSEKSAADFLRRLYRDRRLSADEVAGRLRALDALTSGKLRPPLA